jgi:Mg-chelatase subunit ChlD
MQFNDDEEPPPTTKPAPARPSRLVRLSKYHSSEAPLAPNVQEVLLELKCVSSATYRAPLDLVAVVDVSGSMEGDKLKQAQEALIFIIRKLTDIDRLCIVAFEYTATRHGPLRCVTEAARTELEAVVRGLKANDGTSIKAGLQAGLSVVAQRRFTAGRAANIMLMSDGQDTIPVDDPGNVPVHTFGFGDDHYAHVLEAITNKSLGGVYNYVSDTTDPTNLSQTFSQILAGLVTIIPQDLELTVTAFHGEAAIRDVHAGAYKLIPAGDGSSSVTVKFGALYSSEVRRVIVELALGDRIASPSYHANVAQVQYRFTFQGQQVASDPVVITMNRSRRAPDPADESTKPPPVQAELVRLKHVGSIKAAKEKADQKNMEDAWNILAEALNKLAEAAKKLVDPMFDMLRKELLKMLELFKTWDAYQKRGKAFATSAISSHDHQRIAARGDAEEIRIFSTPRMDIYLEQAKHPGKEIKSADDDALEEPEREPELEVPATPPVEKWRTLSVVLRLLTAVLSLLAFSIMASARASGWAGDRYKAYRLGAAMTCKFSFYFTFLMKSLTILNRGGG